MTNDHINKRMDMMRANIKRQQLNNGEGAIEATKKYLCDSARSRGGHLRTSGNNSDGTLL